jgi:hypothetical protein
MEITDAAILAAFEEHNSKTTAARMLGMSRTHFRRRLSKAQKVEVHGITPAYTTTDPESVIEQLIEAQVKKEQTIELSRSQRITIKDSQPFVIALFADLHLGNNKANYRALRRDTALVRDCPFCYAISAGDHSENACANG